MSKSVLIKDFKSKDVDRMRNLITKKFGNSSSTQVGYSKQLDHHVEGDVWEENGKKWTIKNGIKQSVSKLDKVKKLLSIPLLCPNCSKPLKHYLDKKMFGLKKKCLDCVVAEESLMKIQGTFIDYEKKIFNGNIDLIINDIRDEAADFILNGADSIITESGDIEDWGSNIIDKDKIKSEVEEWIAKLQNMYI